MLRGHVITSPIYIRWGREGDAGTTLPMTVPSVSEVSGRAGMEESRWESVPMDVAFSQEEASVTESGL